MGTREDLVTFETFEQFFDHLKEAIDTKEDVYIFGYLLDDHVPSDYQFLDEDNYLEYYINEFIDFDLLQQRLSGIYSDCEYIHLVLDYVYDSFEDDIIRYKRLYIFRSK